MIDKPVKVCFDHFPRAFGGVVISRPDMYLMILNDDLPIDQVIYVFNHEMVHISKKHLSSKNHKTRQEKELEADVLQWSFDGIRKLNIIIPPQNKL